MFRTFMKRLLSTALSFLLIINGVPFEAQGQQAANAGSTEYSGQGAPLSATELQQLTAPIALYPDALVAQILGAATFPDQVAFASNWLQQNKNLTGKALTQTIDAQQWDPSVKALTQFPSVLDNLAKNLSWTSALGEAYHTQAADVMAAVQVLRAKAQAAGNLKSGSQITVVIAIGAAVNNSWGYSYWNCNWHGGTVVYRSTGYYGNNAWHGGYYGSSASAYGPYGSAHASSGYNPSTGTYARGASTSTAYGKQAVGQAYNPNTGAYAATHQASNAYGN
jgi:Protein of unknown function (DUF3300)